MTKTIKNNNIFKMAKDVKAHVESGKTGLPSSLTYDNITYTWADIMYIMPHAVANPTKDCTIPNIVKPTDAWLGDTINEQVKESDFKKQAENIISFVKNNSNKIPNYVTTISSKKKVNANHYAYCFSKILVWYDNHKKAMPDTCLYRSSDVKKAKTQKKYGHATKRGCDNMGQNNSVNCGPHTLQEIIRNLTGVVISQSQLASWAGTTSSGSSHAGLETAIAMAAKKIGVKLTVKWYNFSDIGWNGIKKVIASNNQDVGIHNLYRRQWGHYETVNSISDSTCKVQNSLGDKCTSSCYCGYVENRSLSEFRSYISGISQKSILVVTRG